MNDYFNLKFVKVNEYGRVVSKKCIENYAIKMHNELDNRINVPKLEWQIHNLIWRNKDISDKDLYKSLSGIVIRNYKKANRGKNDSVANKNIRKFLKDDIYGNVRILMEMRIKYGTVL